MQVTESVVVPATTRVELVKYICDLCKKEVVADPVHGANWAANDPTSSTYDVEKVTITYEDGSHYPDSCNTTTTHVDMCSTCFRDKLMPFLVLHGLENPRTTECYY